jgi:hypothetical protein
MAIYQITKDKLTPLAETKFGAEGLYERKDLQRLLRDRIDVLGGDLLVVAEEFGQWEDSNRRIDLLCLDKQANLVVIELKRTDDGGHMELQAIRYAAMISPMSFSDMIETFAISKNITKPDTDAAKKEVLDFLGWAEPDEDQFGADTRIILAAADFSKEVTTAVMWLNERGLDIRCVRLRPYKMNTGELLLNVEQVVPLPEAEEYQTQINLKKQKEREHRTERYDIRGRFWEGLLSYAKTKTTLHANRKAGMYGWIGGTTGRAGLYLNYVLREDEAQVELYIDYGAGSDEKNERTFEELRKNQEAIDSAFGAPLEWQPLPDRRSCRIRKVLSGGWRSPLSEWPEIQHAMVDAMIRLEKALRPYIERLPT